MADLKVSEPTEARNQSVRICRKCRSAPSDYKHYDRCRACMKAYNAAYRAARKAAGGSIKPAQKTCKKCSATLSWGERCKPCTASTNATYRAKNKESLKAKFACYWAENREANLERLAKYRAKNPEKMKLSREKWKQSNPESAAAAVAKYYKANKEIILKRGQQYKKENADRLRDKRIKWVAANREEISRRSAAHKKRHPERYAARNAERRAKKLQATPVWADRKAISAVYREAAIRSRKTGIPHDVDHIVPLQGVNVCGLHVHYNLRVIPASENRSKNNRYLADAG